MTGDQLEICRECMKPVGPYPEGLDDSLRHCKCGCRETWRVVGDAPVIAAIADILENAPGEVKVF